MTTPTFPLGPPPDPKDPRFLQWLAVLWKYVLTLFTPDNQSTIVAMQVFGKKTVPPAPFGLANPDTQTVEMIQIFGQKPQVFQDSVYSADAQNILASRIFRG